MVTTPIYGFKKIEGTDSPPDITVGEGNWDKVEAEFLKIGYPSSQNILINPDFRVWQRGSFFTQAVAGSKYTADRWKLTSEGGSVSVASNTSANNMVYIVNSVGASDNLAYFVPSEDSLHLIGKTVTISMRVYSPNITTCGIAIFNINGGSAVKSFNLIVGWQTLEFTFTINSISGTMLIQVLRSLAAVGEYMIEYVKLEVGSKATPHTPRPYAEELAMCKRYYQKLGVGLPCYAVDPATLCGSFPYSVQMRGNPTISLLNSSISLRYASGVSTGGATLTGISIFVSTVTASGIVELIFVGTNNPLTQGKEYTIYTDNVFAFDAEL